MFTLSFLKYCQKISNYTKYNPCYSWRCSEPSPLLRIPLGLSYRSGQRPRFLFSDFSSFFLRPKTLKQTNTLFVKLRAIKQPVCLYLVIFLKKYIFGTPKPSRKCALFKKIIVVADFRPLSKVNWGKRFASHTFGCNQTLISVSAIVPS